MKFFLQNTHFFINNKRDPKLFRTTLPSLVLLDYQEP